MHKLKLTVVVMTMIFGASCAGPVSGLLGNKKSDVTSGVYKAKPSPERPTPAGVADRRGIAFDEGIEHMEARRYDEAIRAFARTLKEHRAGPAKPVYYLKYCEAMVLAKTRMYRRKVQLEACDAAVRKTGDGEANRLRQQLATRFAVQTAGEASERAADGYHADAQKLYADAIALAPQPAFFAALCDSSVAGDAPDAVSTCKRAAKHLRGSAKKRALALAKQVGDKPSRSVQAKLAELGKTIELAAAYDDLKRIRACIAAATEAQDAGAKPHHRVNVRTKSYPGAFVVANPNGSPFYFGAFKHAKPFCRARFEKVLEAKN